MTAATDKELSELHKKVSGVLLRQLDSATYAASLLARFRDELPDEVREFIMKQVDASPALLTVCTRFLKDNNVTAVVEDSKELSDLEKRLATKRERKVVGNVVPIHEDYE